MSRELTGSSIAQIIGIAGVAAVIGVGFMMTRAGNVQNETAFIQNAVSNIRGTLANYADASYVTEANVTTGKLVPDNRISGATVTSAWGTVTFAAANVTGSANDGFSIAYPLANMTSRDCKGLVGAVAGQANVVTINTTTVKNSTTALSETAVDTACGNTGSLTFGFSRLGT